MVNSQEPEKLTMKALMTNIGIFYEDPLRNSPQDQDPYRHPVHAPTYSPLRHGLLAPFHPRG
jgi:hypothetical protein